MKKRYSIYFLLLFNLIIKLSFSQDLSIKLDSKEISGNEFSGYIIMELQNNTTDTLLIPLSPFKTELIWSPYSWYSNIRYTTFTHNRISFLKKDVMFNEGSGYDPISYLKFPGILVLPPTNLVKLKLVFEDSVSAKLMSSVWQIVYDVWYAYKKDINKILNKGYTEYKREFEDAFVYKESVEIYTTFDNYIIPDNPKEISNYGFKDNINDSTLFFIKDGEKYDHNYKSAYDKILSLFNHLAE